MSSPVLRLRNYWYIAARSRELRTRPLARTIMCEPLVLFRTGDGMPGALIDRCAHRNTPLSAGRIERGCIECPYHGWRYGTDGACVEVPSLGKGKPLPEMRVRSFPAREQDGFVWVYLGEGEPASEPRPFPHLGEPGWSSFLTVTRFPAGAMACLENFLDCPHTVYVHQGWFRSRNTREVRAVITRTEDQVQAEFFEERDAESVVSRLFFPSGEKMVHTDRFLMPTTSRVDYRFGPDRHFIITSQCTPITADETLVYTMMSFRFGRLGPLVRLLFEPISRRVIRQDVDILRMQTAQVHRFGGPEFKFVESDLLAPHIRELWRQALGTTSASAEPAADEVVLRF